VGDQRSIHNKGNIMTLDDTVATWNQSEIVRLLKNAPGTQYQEADNANKAIIRDWVRSLLQTGAVSVTFVKADGTERQMLCTLKPEQLPPPPVATGPIDGIVRESKKPRKEPDPHSLRVFDLEKSEWRSFRFDRLKKVTAELNFG
jgi:hypothetical protein